MSRDNWIALGVLAFLALALGGGGIIMSVLSIPQIVTVARNAGFAGTDLVTAVAIALAESSGNPNSKGDLDIPQPGSASYGLWQVNSYWHPEYGPDFTVLFDPQTNANAAYAIYSAAGNSFSPWSTFKGGQFQAFVSSVSAQV